MNIWYFHPYGGAPGYGKYLRPYYLGKEWNAAGHSATVFVSQFHHLLDKPEPLPDQFSVGGVRFIALQARAYSGNGVDRLLNMFDFCRSTLRTTKLDLPNPDAIIVSSPHPFSIFPAQQLAKKYSAKLIFEVRDLWPLSLTEIVKIPAWHPFVLLAAFAERYAYRNADVVASLLAFAEPHMLSKGLDANKFLYVPNGLTHDAQPSFPTSAEAKTAKSVIEKWHSEGRKIIIHPGSQGIPNALDLLISAATVLGDDPRFGILLVGSGTETAKLKSQASALSNVFFCPSVSKGEALWLTQHCDIGYAGGRRLPIYRFGTSFNKVADFIRFGLPVIEIVDTGAGVASANDTPAAISKSIEEILSIDLNKIRKNQKIIAKNLAYKKIAHEYIKSII